MEASGDNTPVKPRQDVHWMYWFNNGAGTGNEAATGMRYKRGDNIYARNVLTSIYVLMLESIELAGETAERKC